MIGKAFGAIEPSDFPRLLESGVPESKFIEYKSVLPDESADKRKEFLYDVSSFANAEGGDLVFGITESSGIPKKINGVSISDNDKEILLWDNLIRDGISPRIQAEIKIFEIDSLKLLLIRVYKSWNKPHRVEYKGSHKFYSRNSAGKYLLEVEELRGLFLSSAEFVDRAREFIDQRNKAIFKNEGIFALGPKGKMAIYLIPMDFVSGSQVKDLLSIQSKLQPPFSDGWNSRVNLEGVAKYSPQGANAHSYVQVYRNGIIEAVTSGLLAGFDDADRYIPSNAVEKVMIQGVGTYLNVMKDLEKFPPILIGFSFLGVKGYSLGVGHTIFSFHTVYPFDRDVLRLPELVVTEYPDRTDVLLHDTIDTLWNAFGFDRSNNFDAEGHWVPK